MEKILILDRGNLEFHYPGDWNVAKDRGSTRLSDPTESCRLDVSYAPLPSDSSPPPAAELLRRLLEHVKEADPDTEIEEIDEGSRHLAWCDYRYVSTDKRTGEPDTARGRWLVGQNHLFQVLMTFYYWDDDAAWAIPVWTRVVETLHFGDGTKLHSPDEHWSMRPRN